MITLPPVKPKRTAFSLPVILGLDPRIANGTTGEGLPEYRGFRAWGDPRVEPEDDERRGLSAYSTLILMPMGLGPASFTLLGIFP